MDRLNIGDVKLLMAEGEGLSIEFKEKYTPKIDRDLVAFANTKGGRILLGVKDDGSVIGEKLTNRLKAEIQTLARQCDPPLDIHQVNQIGDVVVIDDNFGIRISEILRRPEIEDISLP